jgi:hypothetical protein
MLQKTVLSITPHSLLLIARDILAAVALVLAMYRSKNFPISVWHLQVCGVTDNISAFQIRQLYSVICIATAKPLFPMFLLYRILTQLGTLNWTNQIFHAYRSVLCGLVVRVPGYRSRGPDSIPGTTRFSEK